MKALDDSDGFLLVAPTHFRFGLAIAGYTLLRLLKSPFARYLNKDVEHCLQTTIDLSQRLFEHGSETAHKHACALTQLWSSKKAFKKNDGSDYTVLRIRTRLAMSPTFDAIWWWKEEFHGQKGAFANTTQPNTSNISLPTPGTSADQNNFIEKPLVEDMSSAFDEQLFAEFGFGNDFDSEMFGWPSLPIDKAFQ